MTFTACAYTVGVVTCAYSAVMGLYAQSKEDDYSRLYDQMKIIKDLKERLLAESQGKPEETARVKTYFAPNGMAFAKGDFHYGKKTLTLPEAQAEMSKLDQEIRFLQRISPIDIFCKYNGIDKGWKRNRPIVFE